MSLETYRLLHITGMFVLFLGLGGILLKSEGKSNRMGMILHGSGMVLMLVAGFGAAARVAPGFPWPMWIWGKLVVWLLIGALPSMHKRGVVPTNIAWIVAIALGVGAAALALHKP